MKRVPAIKPDTVYKTEPYTTRKASYFSTFCRTCGRGMWSHTGWYSAERVSNYQTIYLCNQCAKEVGWIW